jgi:Predicted Peptidoglycan domain
VLILSARLQRSTNTSGEDNLSRHAHRVPIYSINGGDRPMVYVSRKEAESLEEACGLCGLPLTEDGLMGAQTLSVLNMCNSGALLAEFKALATEYYRNLAREHLALQRFLGGWLKRASD